MTIRLGFSARDNPSAIEVYVARTCVIFPFLRPSGMPRVQLSRRLKSSERDAPTSRIIAPPRISRFSVRRTQCRSGEMLVAPSATRPTKADCKRTEGQPICANSLGSRGTSKAYLQALRMRTESGLRETCPFGVHLLESAPRNPNGKQHARVERAAITAATGVARSATLMRLPLGSLLIEPPSAFPLTEHHCDLGTDDKPDWVISSR